MKEVTVEELSQILSSEKIVFVDFWGEACRPCDAIAPILEKFSSDSDFSSIYFTSLNITKEPMAGAIYGVFSVPTLLFFKNGKEVDRKIGFISEKEIRTWFLKWKED